MFTKKFWKALAERSITGGASAALLVIGGDTFNVVHADWQTIVGFAAGGALISILKGLSVQAVTGNGPGIGGSETLT